MKTEPQPQLVISDSLSLPVDAVTAKMAHMGGSGSGKTYCMGKVAEEMYKVGAQIVILDPVGAHWGLRSAADGKSPGLPIPVFGGLHGDVPLLPGSGPMIADLIVDRGISAIIDVSQFDTDAEMTRWATEFGDRFWQRKKSNPSAVHLFIDECQEFVPQNPMKGEERKLHVYQRLQKQGRNFGIGLSLGSQRPQEVSKKVLNLSKCMFAYNMTGPQERDAMKDWMRVAGMTASEDIIGLLPTLKIGQPYIWSPAWLEVSRVVKIAPKTTFDSSATPKFGEKYVPPKLLTPVDLDEIRSAMADIIEQAKQDDPKELQKQIKQLQAEIARLQKGGQVKQAPPPKPEIRYVDRPVYDPEIVERLEALTNDERLLAKQKLELAALLEDGLKRKDAPFAKPAWAGGVTLTAKKPVKPGDYLDSDSVVLPVDVITNDKSAVITDSHKRILLVLKNFGDGLSRKRLAIIAGYRHNGGGFGKILRDLRDWGWITTGAALLITEAGKTSLAGLGGYWEPLPIGKALGEYWLQHLDPSESKILATAMRHYPNQIGRVKLAHESGYTNPNGGGFTKPLRRVRALGLLEGKSLFRVNGELMGASE